MTRGEIAKECGINIETLRYYEKIKVIDPPKRSAVGYRLYCKEYVVKIRFIQNAKKLGFTLNEISEFMKFLDDKKGHCNSAKGIAQKKLDEVVRKIEGLKFMRKVLQKLIHQCDENVLTRDCPILTSLLSRPEP